MMAARLMTEPDASFPITILDRTNLSVTRVLATTGKQIGNVTASIALGQKVIIALCIGKLKAEHG